MSGSYGPTSYEQRGQVIERMDTYAADPSSDSTLVALILGKVGTAKGAYLTAYDDHTASESEAKVAAKALAASRATAFSTLRRLSASMRDSEGREDTETFAALLDEHTISQLTRMADGRAQAFIDKLLRRLPGRTDLSYDADKATALQTANDAFLGDIAAYADADRTKTARGKALAAAIKDFDDAYGRLIHAAKASLSKTEVEEAFPRFVRRAKADKAAKVSPSADAGATTSEASTSEASADAAASTDPSTSP